jgi:hypothetical protein
MWLSSLLLVIISGQISIIAHWTLQSLSAQISSLIYHSAWNFLFFCVRSETFTLMSLKKAVVISFTAWNEWQQQFCVGLLCYSGFLKSDLLLLTKSFDLTFIQYTHGLESFSRLALLHCVGLLFFFGCKESVLLLLSLFWLDVHAVLSSPRTLCPHMNFYPTRRPFSIHNVLRSTDQPLPN